MSGPSSLLLLEFAPKNPPLAALLFGVIGAVIASFFATEALRLRAGGSALIGRSACDHCKAPISYFASLPLISYLALKGRCANCKGAIRPLHPVGEVLGFGCGFLALLLIPVPRGLLVALALTLLTGLGLIDSQTRRLPDPFTFALGLVGLMLSGLTGAQSLLIAIASSAAWLVLLLIVRKATFPFKKVTGPSLGLGDVKLIASGALWLGLLTPFALLFASLLALPFALRTQSPDRRIPFGPFVAIGFGLVGFCSEAGFLPDWARPL